MDKLTTSHFDSRLHALIKDIDLQTLSRVPSSRLSERALPNIGRIELVSGSAFNNDYDPLYTTMFHGGERERSDLIVQRLEDDFAGRREGLFPYRIVGIRDPRGEAVGAAQFSVLFLASEAGERYAVPYLQYIYVRAQNRRQDMSEVLHTMVLAVATAEAKLADNGDRSVPFTLFETEPPGHGSTAASQTNATERTSIHSKSGARAVMLRPQGASDATDAISGHVQPGLEPEDSPITLIWAIRPSPLPNMNYDIQQCGEALAAAYYHSIRDEGFPEKNIALAESMLAKRAKGREWFEMPLSGVSAAMYKDLDGDAER
jgi:hypothetical protein